MDPLLGQERPNAPELEQAVLAASLIDGDALNRVVDLLSPDSFYVEANAIIFRCIVHLFREFTPVDVLTVTHELKRRKWLDRVGGAYYLVRIASSVSSGANIEAHARIVAQMHVQRELITAFHRGTQRAHDPASDVFEVVDDATTAVQDVLAGYVVHGALPYAKHELAAKELQAVSFSTGFGALDEVLGGWKPGNLVVVAGRPGMGKTSTVLSMANALANRGTPTLLLQMELTLMENQARLAAMRKGIPLHHIVNGHMSAHDEALREQGVAEAQDLPLFIRYDTALTLADLQAEITRNVRMHGIRVVFIDQLNWIKPPSRANRNEELGAVTRALKQIALKMGITVIVAHQLSRDIERRTGSKVPVLSDLRDSGNVEQDAQMVIFCYRPEYYCIAEDDRGQPTEGLIQWIVAKNSNGPLGVANLHFRKYSASVHDQEITPSITSDDPF